MGKGETHPQFLATPLRGGIETQEREREEERGEGGRELGEGLLPPASRGIIGPASGVI